MFVCGVDARRWKRAAHVWQGSANEQNGSGMVQWHVCSCSHGSAASCFAETNTVRVAGNAVLRPWRVADAPTPPPPQAGRHQMRAALVLNQPPGGWVHSESCPYNCHGWFKRATTAACAEHGAPTCWGTATARVGDRHRQTATRHTGATKRAQLSMNAWSSLQPGQRVCACPASHPASAAAQPCCRAAHGQGGTCGTRTSRQHAPAAECCAGVSSAHTCRPVR